MKKIKIMCMAVPMLIGSLMVSNANAADGRLSLGVELGLPMGDFGDNQSTGFGGSLRYEMPMGNNLGLSLTAGYLTFAGKTVSGVDVPSLGLIPVQVGAKYYFQEQQKGFYGMVELGAHMIQSQTLSYSYTDPISGQTITSEIETDSQTKFSYAPAVGYHLDNIDIGLRYQIISTEGSTTSYLGLRAAYVFGGK